MAGMRMAAPLWALREGYSPGWVGVLLALFALSQVFWPCLQAVLPTATV
jgi:hypothetical protein